MSYLVLARKYRSRTFEALVGQEHVVQALSNALTQGRLHHAYLFTGTRGVGKTSVARILAKSLNCTAADGSGGVTAQPCGVCDACRDIDAGRFVDYIELDAASNRGVDEISLLLDQAVYKPVVGRFKVYMIDEVHMLSNHAFNAMLKTLEEPPDYLKFILATTDPQKVPATVLSRCLQFNLRPMAPPTVHEHLAHVLADEAIAAESGALRLLSRAARGSMRDALSLADQAIAFGAGTLTEAGVRQMLGAVDRGHAVRIVEALAASDGTALVAAADGLRDLGLSAAGTLEEIADLLQQMALAQAVPDALDASDPDTVAARRLAPALAADETQLHYSIALHGRAELALAPDEHSGLVMVLLRMLAFRPAGQAGAGMRPRETGATAAAGGMAPVGPAAALATASVAGRAADAATPAAPLPLPAPAIDVASPAVLPPAPGAAAAPLPLTPPVAGPVPEAAARSTASRQPVTAAPSSVSAAAAMPAVTAATRVTVVRRATPGDAPATSRSNVPPRGDDLPPWLDAGPDGDVPPPTAFYEDAAPADAAEAWPTVAAPRAARPASAAVAPLAEPVAAPPAAAALRKTPAGDRWAQVVGALIATGSVTALTRELALQAQCLGVDEHAVPAVWRLRVEREVLRSPTQRDRLQAALADHLGRPVSLDVSAGPAEDSPALRDAADRARRQREAEQLIQDDPLVRALLAQFKTARIVPGSVRPIDGTTRSDS